MNRKVERGLKWVPHLPGLCRAQGRAQLHCHLSLQHPAQRGSDSRGMGVTQRVTLGVSELPEHWRSRRQHCRASQ